LCAKNWQLPIQALRQTGEQGSTLLVELWDEEEVLGHTVLLLRQ